MRIPSSVGGGVMVRAGVVVPKGNAGFDASELEGADVPNEKLAAGLVSE